MKTLILFACVLLVFPISAMATELNIQSTNYSTSLKTQVADLVQHTFQLRSDSRTQTSWAPISDQMQLVGVDYSVDPPRPFPLPYNFAEASASADPFHLVVETHADMQHEDFSWATASEVILFSPVISRSTPIRLDIFRFWEADFYSSGMISLDDVTSNQELWNFYWKESGQGTNIDWTFPGPVTSIAIDTYLSTDDVYRLTMSISCDANGDNERVIANVSLLEPSSLLLLASGLAGLAGLAWRRKQK